MILSWKSLALFPWNVALEGIALTHVICQLGDQKMWTVGFSGRAFHIGYCGGKLWFRFSGETFETVTSSVDYTTFSISFPLRIKQIEILRSLCSLIICLFWEVGMFKMKTTACLLQLNLSQGPNEWVLCVLPQHLSQKSHKRTFLTVAIWKKCWLVICSLSEATLSLTLSIMIKQVSFNESPLIYSSPNHKQVQHKRA